MSEKVLGFYEKDLESNLKEYLWFGANAPKQAKIEIIDHEGNESLVRLIPVVSLDWLQKFCEKNMDSDGRSWNPTVCVSELLLAAKKEAGKK